MDPTGFEQVYRQHYGGLHAHARSYVNDPAAAEDIVQDVFLAVWRRWDRLQVHGTMRAYLYAAVRNTSLDRLKQRAGVRRPAGDAALATGRPLQPTDWEVRHNELARAIDAAIRQLPKRAGEVFIMSREGGLTYAEIADVLGVSVKAVEASISRALRSLREQLGPFPEGERNAEVGSKAAWSSM